MTDMTWKNVGLLPVIFMAWNLASCGPSPPVLESIRYSKDTTEERIAVSGMPIFKDNGDSVGVEIQTTQGYEIWPLSWPEVQIPHRALATDRSFLFEILRDVSPQRGGTGFRHSSLLRVADGDKVPFNASLCEVHHLRMSRELERSDDPSAYTELFNRNRWKYFPNDGRVTGCDCSYQPAKATWICPECLKRSTRDRARSLVN